MERHEISFDDLVGLHSLDYVALAPFPTPEDRQVLQLITDSGRFTFPTALWGSAIEPRGHWEPGVTAPASLGLVVMCRAVPNAEKQVRRLYCVDEATSLVVLEFGYLDRRYDDPNLRTAWVGVFKWEGGTGWESPYLVEPEESGGVEIKRRFAFTPKRVGAGRPKGNY
jgi:hypothetical protein